MNAKIDEAAADWLARRFAGFSPEQEIEFRGWLRADARHAAAFQELEATWKLLDGVRETAPIGAEPDPDALMPQRPVRKTIWLPRFVAAAAAVVALACVQAWRSARPALQFSDEVATAVGDFQRLALPDGSVVRLNTNSRVRVRYTEGERRVQLVRGEAHFIVAKNPLRPFVVEAGTVAVRAVGTAFNVRLRADDVEVLVTEGKVHVADPSLGESLIVPRSPASPPLLVAGERAIVPISVAAGGVRPRAEANVVEPPEIERALAWQERRIEFVSAPLAEIVAEFNRHNRRAITIADPVLAARRFGGSFRADEPETFVRILQTRFGLEVEQAGDATILRTGPAAQVP